MNIDGTYISGAAGRSCTERCFNDCSTLGCSKGRSSKPRLTKPGSSGKKVVFQKENFQLSSFLTPSF